MGADLFLNKRYEKNESREGESGVQKCQAGRRTAKSEAALG